MADITTVWNVQRIRGDWVLSGPSLLSGDDLTTAVLISLFTDRLALPSDETPDGDRRGWWGDNTDPRYLIGSRLWLLDRVKGPLQVPRRAKDYAAEALQWMIDDGVVASFDITAKWVTPDRLYMQIIANRSDGSTVAMQFANLWKQT